MIGRAISPALARSWAEDGRVELLDQRTWPERALMGKPVGSRPVSLIRQLLRPAGPEAVYLCAHAVRSKWTLRRGAVEVDGGFRRWRRDGQPTSRGKG